MKKMKLRAILIVCSFLLVMIFCGCGKALPIEQIDESQRKTNVDVSHDSTPTENVASAQEETLKEKALREYREILKAAPAIEGEHEELFDVSFDCEQNRELFGDHYELFALNDINQDGIPELIALSMVNFRWTQIYVYTYANGQAVLLKDQSYPEAQCTFDQNSTANGAYIIYFCEKNHIHSVWRGTTPIGEVEENSAYALEGTCWNAVECTIEESENSINFYVVAMENTIENVDAMINEK